ncbi:hypothetical protein NDU88_005925 [Pleurodeles waltl]|uniref:Secreted protein n=1 Tax=Pleurodeles waltl TaxID=8319 RepID=A0AAV7MZU0_PLEWA|nr:hypothetical protein NDU88_005925 [Pleurodeles waltl]
MTQTCVPALVGACWPVPSVPCPYWSCPTGSTGVRSLPPPASAAIGLAGVVWGPSWPMRGWRPRVARARLPMRAWLDYPVTHVASFHTEQVLELRPGT